MIDIKETQEWYANERNIKVDEFDDYDAHVCRVANAYGNVVKKLTIPVVVGQSEQLPKSLSNKAYKYANKMTYEGFVEWWDLYS